MAELNVRTSYPFDPIYEYETRLVRINLDEERIKDLQNSKGFIVSEPQSIKKDIKDYNGIFSTRFGQTLQDVNPLANKYTCECKNPKLQGRFYLGFECPICHTKVKYVGEEMDFFGYIILEDPYHLIHPNLYKTIEFLIGAKYLDRILKYDIPKNEDGFDIVDIPKPKGEPYYGIGIIEFYEKFDEIIAYYYKKNPNKVDYYNDLLKYRDMVFIQSIPVYTTYLRPFKIDSASLFYEGANAVYNILAKHAAIVNKKNMSMTKRAKRPKNELLFDMQQNINKLEKDIEESLAKKKGQIRTLFGGRFNFTSHCVIVSDPWLRSSQIRLPYIALVETLQQVIINILHRSYGISYDAAWKIWYRAKIKKDKRVYDIIEGLIKDSGEGLPFFINRPPTIQYGSTLFMRCVGINDNYSMSVPLEILGLIAGDFDGDALSALWIINKEVERAGEATFSPRYAMYISRNDGMFNNSVNHQKDIVIANCNLIDMSRKYYTPEELSIIRQAQMMEDEDTVGRTAASRVILNNREPDMDDIDDFIKQCSHYANWYGEAFS